MELKYCKFFHTFSSLCLAEDMYLNMMIRMPYLKGPSLVQQVNKLYKFSSHCSILASIQGNDYNIYHHGLSIELVHYLDKSLHKLTGSNPIVRPSKPRMNQFRCSILVSHLGKACIPQPSSSVVLQDTQQHNHVLHEKSMVYLKDMPHIDQFYGCKMVGLMSILHNEIN